MTEIFIAAAAALLSTTASAHVSGMFVQGAPTARVNYADINLQTVAGRDRLTRRIRSAASLLCNEATVEPLEMRMERIECYRFAVASGTAQVAGLTARQSASDSRG
jgi:UrcA family protein